MSLRATKRKKDGKTHLYWSLVESVRVGRRVFQRQALYLGELNDSQKDEWQRTVEAFDEKGCARQLKLFPEDRAPDIVMYRFTAPGSELQMHSNWLANTAVEELVGPGALTGRSTLYACLDRVLWPSRRTGSFRATSC